MNKILTTKENLCEQEIDITTRKYKGIWKEN